jgi:hypothetical protein
VLLCVASNRRQWIGLLLIFSRGVEQQSFHCSCKQTFKATKVRNYKFKFSSVNFGRKRFTKSTPGAGVPKSHLQERRQNSGASAVSGAVDGGREHADISGHLLRAGDQYFPRGPALGSSQRRRGLWCPRGLAPRAAAPDVPRPGIEFMNLHSGKKTLRTVFQNLILDLLIS